MTLNYVLLHKTGISGLKGMLLTARFSKLFLKGKLFKSPR